MPKKAILLCAALAALCPPAVSFLIPSAAAQTAAAREDSLDPSPVNPASDPDTNLFLNDWRNATPRREHGQLVFHDILTRLDSDDPVHPHRRGAVLTAISSVSYVTLKPGATASGKVQAGMREIFYAVSGNGSLSVNGKPHAISEGVGFTLTPDFTFTLINQGKANLAFYARTEPLPASAKPSPDVVVTSRWDNDRRVGAHWVHICNGGPAGMNLCTVAPYTMPQPHSHPTEEAWILVKGESILTLGKTMVRMQPGQAYKIPPTRVTAHSNLNLTDEPIQLIYLGPAERIGGPPPPADYARLDNSPIAPLTAIDVDMFMGNAREAYPRIAHGNLYLRDMLTAFQDQDPTHPSRKGAVLLDSDAISSGMLEPGSTAHRLAGELKGQQETLVVSSGEGYIETGGKRSALSPGMAVILGPDTEFSLVATGKRYMTFHVITERLQAGKNGPKEARIIDHRTAPSALHDWYDTTRVLVGAGDGLARYSAIAEVSQKALSMDRPHSAAPGEEEIWIALDDVDILFGKQLRHITAGTGLKIPPTGITAKATVNAGASPVRFLKVMTGPR